MKRERILIVEDDPTMALGLVFNLRSEDHEVDHVLNGKDALRAWVPGAWDLVILDIMLPGISGLEVLSLRRVHDPRTPVLILSALGRPDDIVEGLDRGADDYLAKPFLLEVLLARVRSLLRARARLKSGPTPDSAPDPVSEDSPPLNRQVRLGSMTADLGVQTLRTPSAEVPLTHKESMLLAVLASRRGRVVRREDLLLEVWGYGDGIQTRTLDTFITGLRRKLGDDGRRPRWLRTASGEGYLLAAEEEG